MDNLHASIAELLQEGTRRDKARQEAIAKKRERAGAAGEAYTQHESQTKQREKQDRRHKK